MKIAVAMITLLIVLGGARAQEGHIATVIGVGSKSCGAWTQARHTSSPLVDVYKIWIEGLLTGVNNVFVELKKIDPLDDAVTRNDEEGLWAWIDNYCQTNPLDSIAAASSSLAAELLRQSTQHHQKK